MAKSLKKQEKKTTGEKAAKPVKHARSSSMDTLEIRDFISFIAQSGLNEVKIETSKLKLHVKRNADQSSPSPNNIPVVPAQPAFADIPLSPKEDREAPDSEKNTSESASTTVVIKSPMVGTFYRSPNPKADPFVSVGDKVKKGQVVCIIEAMKLFNEIESEVSGTVVKVLAESASPVEYEQPLFLIEFD